MNRNVAQRVEKHNALCNTTIQIAPVADGAHQDGRDGTRSVSTVWVPDGVLAHMLFNRTLAVHAPLAVDHFPCTMRSPPMFMPALSIEGGSGGLPGCEGLLL
jgi:hypothetical protein